MSPGDVYLLHKRREKSILFYIVQWQLDATKTLQLTVHLHGVLHQANFWALTGQIVIPTRADALPYPGFCKAAGQEILISDWVNTSW